MKKLLTALITATAIAITALFAVSPAGAQTLPEVDKEVAWDVDGALFIHECDDWVCRENPYSISGGAMYLDGTGVLEVYGFRSGWQTIEVTAWELPGVESDGSISFIYNGFYNSHHLSGPLLEDSRGDYRGLFENSDPDDPIEVDLWLELYPA